MTSSPAYYRWTLVEVHLRRKAEVDGPLRGEFGSSQTDGGMCRSCCFLPATINAEPGSGKGVDSSIDQRASGSRGLLAAVATSFSNGGEGGSLESGVLKNSLQRPKGGP